ncbi:hypothetical protein J5N97_029310 [Dioscorea zingiberensis]|uniref:Uncharacterized protein n=1 Tax=Dioscorea zingiberensis TaxID=325984 RepID=A0A9D5H5Q0_9LILI|nr:hypothetical protein J5N97_029310 [Dioscorea zingiberensis]
MKRSFISFSRLQRRGPSLQPWRNPHHPALPSSMDFSPTADELEVADVLLQLQHPFIINPEPPPLRYVDILPRWGRRRPRTIPSPDPSPPPETKEPIPDAAAVAAASSPSTPMSFPATSEEAEPKPSPKKPWPFPNSKLHKEWLRRENEKIALLSALKVKFFQDLAALKSSHQRLQARNSWLKNIRFQLKGEERKRRRVMGNEGGNRNNGSDHARLDGQHPMNGWDATAVGPNVGKRVWMLPDLNETAEEVDRRERAAQARKQRLEMQRKKRSPPLPPRPPTRCKISRIRST